MIAPGRSAHRWNPGAVALRICLAALLALLCACQPRPAPETEPAAEPPWPVHDYTPGEGARIWKLDPQSSAIDIVVRREGPLAHMGHDHVIVAAPEGWLRWADDPAQRRADLRFAAADLDTDPEAARIRYALDTEPDAEAVAGTRRNMLEKVLEAGRWPWIRLTADRIDGTLERPLFRATITVRGTQSGRVIELSGVQGDGSLSLSGTLSLRQTDFGIEPLTALGGGLRVSDELTLHLRLRGDAVAAPSR